MQLIVGQFNDSYEPVMDGVANVTKNYAYWLDKMGCKSYVITPSFPGYEDETHPEVIRYFSVPIPVRKPYRFGMPQFDYPFKQDVKAIPFDIVHCHSPFSSGQLALKLAKKRGIPVVTTFHSKYYDDFKEALKSDTLAKLLVNRVIDFYREVDEVWTVNQATAKTLREYGYEGRIEIVHNGTDFQPCNDEEACREKASKFLQVDDKELTLLFVGQHIWQKNLKMLVNSLKHVKEKGVKFKMFFVGEGVAKKDLEKLVEDNNLQHCIKFLGLITDRDLLRAIFVRADLFLFPSLYDTFGIVVREAAVVKTPSLVIAGSNAAEDIEDGYNGFLSADDEIEYGEKIIEITKNIDTLKTAGLNANKTLYKSWEYIVADVKERYMELIKKHKY
ncbi:glycosyltransferase [Clostridium thermarum]|uniref:glycosyltransferase n=1 Tax=Clostridium thermarum TaxID=1716543 RepID=UPI001FA9DF7A|nr:glycosyltransferase [Clostridium thermarum]